MYKKYKKVLYANKKAAKNKKTDASVTEHLPDKPCGITKPVKLFAIAYKNMK